MSKNDLYKRINSSINNLSTYNDIDFALSDIDKNNYPQEIVILHKLCLLRITIDDKKTPYNQITGNVIVEIAKDNMDLLIEYLNNLENPLLIGRIADILWLTKTDTKIYNPIQYAKKSIENFSKTTLSSDNYSDVLECYQRALILHTQTKQAIDKDYITSQLNNAILSTYTLDAPFFQRDVAQVLLGYNLLTDFDQLTDKLISIGENRCAEFGIIFGTIEYLELALESCINAKNTEKQFSVLQKIIEIYTKESDGSSQGLRARFFYEKALQAARKIPSNNRSKSLINDLETRIFTTGAIIKDQLFEITGPSINISELCSRSKLFMSKIDDAKEALIKFSQINAIQSYESLRTICIESNSNSNSMIGALIPTTILSHDGRTTMTMPCFDQNNIDIVEQYMTKNFNEVLLTFLINSCIYPSFYILSNDHEITLDDLKEFCQFSSIIPSDRIELISKALYFGFQGDFQTSIYLLSPQVENIIRQLLKAKNISTTHIDKDNNQTENGLSSLLGSIEIQDILDKDTLFFLKALFTSQLGPNLRNNAAHGLLNDQESNTEAVVYAWWFIFQWIMKTQKST